VTTRTPLPSLATPTSGSAGACSFEATGIIRRS
jgi:hypothetical protein